MQEEDFRIIQSLIRDVKEEVQRLTLRFERIETKLKMKLKREDFKNPEIFDEFFDDER